MGRTIFTGMDDNRPCFYGNTLKLGSGAAGHER